MARARKRTSRRTETATEGLELRDLFAAFAMAGMLINNEDLEDEEVAESAYALADSMIEQRGDPGDDD